MAGVRGGWIDAAGGGCSAPPVSRVKGDWAQHLGGIRGEAWALANGDSRLPLSFRHPMDTGLVANIATYHLGTPSVKDAVGRALGEMEIWASAAEDLAIMLMPMVQAGERLTVEARDTNGCDYRAQVEVAKLSPMRAATSVARGFNSPSY